VDRIISLLPSLTEITCALGLRGRLVGRSHECNHPPGLDALPVCTEPKFEPTGSSAQIDGRVKMLVRDGLSVYRVDPERLRALAPDVILTQDHCEVCAASLSDVEEALAEWTGASPRVVSVSPACLADVWRSMGHIAEALGASEQGQRLVANLTSRLTGIGEQTGAASFRPPGEASPRPPGEASPRPRLGCIEWIEPLMSAGNWVPELAAIAGGEVCFGTAGEHSPWLDWEAFRAADPDVVAIMPCGFDLARCREELPLLEGLPGWSELTAVKRGRAFLADGNQYFNRPGPRLVESAEILSEMLHPDRCDFGHRGVAFEAV